MAFTDDANLVVLRHSVMIEQSEEAYQAQIDIFVNSKKYDRLDEVIDQLNRQQGDFVMTEELCRELSELLTGGKKIIMGAIMRNQVSRLRESLAFIKKGQEEGFGLEE